MIRAKNVTPSIRAAAMIMAVWMLPAISGWRAMLSTADLARPPMPRAAPMITRPAPIALRSENGAFATARSAVGLGDRSEPLGDQQQAEGQDGGLDEFHRTLDSLIGHTRGRHCGASQRPAAIETKPHGLASENAQSPRIGTHQRPTTDAPLATGLRPAQCGWTAEPMNSADRKVKMYACKNATNSSSRLRQITPDDARRRDQVERRRPLRHAG